MMRRETSSSNQNAHVHPRHLIQEPRFRIIREVRHQRRTVRTRLGS